MKHTFETACLAFVLLACGDSGGGFPDGGMTGDSGGGPDGSMSGDGSMMDGAMPDGSTGNAIKTVFLIMMENHSWSDIKGSGSAPYINSLLSMGGHAEQYYTPAGNHPSEPNYIWIEAGDNLGITNDNDPSANHQATTDHLVSQLQKANVTWRSYAEDISGTGCPQANAGLFAVRHVPQLFFDDVTSNLQSCQQHVRPYAELANDLKNGTTARFNFITPNLCDDMHGETFGTTCNIIASDLVKLGDTFLSKAIPAIQASTAYTNGGAIFIVWDEGSGVITGSDGPIPFLVLSPLAKTSYTSMTKYTHSSTLRTMETIFGVPYLRGAQTSNDLSDFFMAFP